MSEEEIRVKKDCWLCRWMILEPVTHRKLTLKMSCTQHAQLCKEVCDQFELWEPLKSSRKV